MAPNPNRLQKLALLLDNGPSAGTAEPVQIVSQPTPSHLLPKSSERKRSSKETPKYKWEVVWRNVFIFIVLHYFLFYGAYLWIFKVKWATFFFVYAYATFAGFGITAGAHRLWAHRTYKANFALRLFLMLGQSAALQNHIFEWVRDHRVHHKFTDTDADPHNSRRGFFFSHIGWLMLKKHKDVFQKGKTVDMSDVAADPLVRFQKTFYVPLVIALTFVIPSVIPWYFWNEDGWLSFYICIFRYCLSLNGTWLVNSAAHIYGMKPYDKTMNPTENKFVSIMAYGEGWHNYHHTFPWDYKAAELGNYRFNFTTGFLDLMSKIGWATELKTASVEMVKKRALRTGDGSWVNSRKEDTNSEVIDDEDDDHHHHGPHLWGWGDKDMEAEEKTEVKLFNNIK